MENDDPFARKEVGSFEIDALPDDFLDEVDRELEALQSAPEVVSDLQFTAEEAANDGLSSDPGVRQMQMLYLDIARNNLSPVSRYMKALTQGESFRDLLELSEMVVTPLLPKTEEVGLQQHADDLTFFRSLLYLALGERDQDAMHAMREVVMEGYSKLSDRFGLSYRGYRLAVKNLVQFYRRLRSSEGISEIDVRRFFAIGVPSLTWVRRTKVSEMTSLSGISPEAMAVIRKAAYIYRVQPTVAGASLAKDDFFQGEEIQQSQIVTELDLSDLSEADVMDSEVLASSVRQPRGTA